MPVAQSLSQPQRYCIASSDPSAKFLLQLPAAEAFVRPRQLCKRSHDKSSPNDWTFPKLPGFRVPLAKAN